MIGLVEKAISVNDTLWTSRLDRPRPISVLQDWKAFSAIGNAVGGRALRPFAKLDALMGRRLQVGSWVAVPQNDDVRNEIRAIGLKHHKMNTMEHYAGIDASLKESSVCIVDAKEKVVREVKVASGPDVLSVISTIWIC